MKVTPQVDPASGRTVLREVLEAWKSGKTSESFASQTPSIRVADEDWLSGAELLSYEIEPNDKVVGEILRAGVSVELKSKGGKLAKKRVFYNITTAPTPSVIRQD